MNIKTSSNILIRTILVAVLILIQFTNFTLGIFYSGFSQMFHLSLLIPLLLSISVLIILAINFDKFRMILGVIHTLLIIFSLRSLISLISFLINHPTSATSQMILTIISSFVGIILLTCYIIYFFFKKPKHYIWMMMVLIISFIQMIILSFQMRNYLIHFVYSLGLYEAINVFRYILLILYIPLFVIFLYFSTKEEKLVEANL